MPTQDQVRGLEADFEREYPESLSDRLQWWARVLDIDRIRLFQLLGLSRPQAARVAASLFLLLARRHPRQVRIVDAKKTYVPLGDEPVKTAVAPASSP